MTILRRREVPWPTGLGWCLVIAIAASIFCTWWFAAEKFFAVTDRRDADVLVVESWIGIEGMAAAKSEFEHGSYAYIVTSGGPDHDPWEREVATYGEKGADELIRLGVPRDKIVLPHPRDTAGLRTYTAAAAVKARLAELGIHPRAINLFTLGVHARRSRLIFSRVLDPVNVGVISWLPQSLIGGPWWHYSERAEELIKETVGWPYELILHSGRFSQRSPAPVKT